MNAKNGALTFAFTIAGACIGYAMRESMGLPYVVLVVGSIGAMAALFGDDK
jgi:hypothetical protein